TAAAGRKALGRCQHPSRLFRHRDPPCLHNSCDGCEVAVRSRTELRRSRYATRPRGGEGFSAGNSSPKASRNLLLASSSRARRIQLSAKRRKLSLTKADEAAAACSKQHLAFARQSFGFPGIWHLLSHSLRRTEARLSSPI